MSNGADVMVSLTASSPAGPAPSRCPFCSQRQAQERNPSPTPRAPIIADVAQLVRGYYLIFPEECVGPFRALPQEVIEQACVTAEVLRDTLRRDLARPVILFEHGSLRTPESQIQCSIDHAHLHVMAAGEELTVAMVTESVLQIVPTLAICKAERFLDITALVPENRAYLYFQDSTGDAIVCVSDRPRERAFLPSQFINKLVSELGWVRQANAQWLRSNGLAMELLKNSWDYRVFRPRDRYDASVQYLACRQHELEQEVPHRLRACPSAR